MRDVHPVVRDVVAADLALIDAEAPRLVRSLYLSSSVALSDVHPAASGLDIVAVTATGCDTADVVALRRTHAQLAARHRRPAVEGPSVTWDHLAHDPLVAAPGPYAQGRQVQPAVSRERHPVTGHTLAHHGIAVRGPQPQEVNIWIDRDGLASWAWENLQRYCCPWHRRSARLLSTPGLARLGS